MESFEFRVYSHRKSIYVTYKLMRTGNGWKIPNILCNDDSSPDGMPALYANLDQDIISYPNNLGNFLGHIWSRIDSKELTQSEAQSRINELAAWVSNCEIGQPKWDKFNMTSISLSVEM